MGTEEPREITGLEPLQAEVDRLCAAARHRVDLLTPDLEPRLYDRQPVLDALRGVATGSRRGRIRVLVGDSGPAVRGGHRLIELARHLSSFFELRQLARKDADFGEALLIVDRRGLIQRPRWTRHEGWAWDNAPRQARSLLETFEALWADAQPDPELRRLHL